MAIKRKSLEIFHAERSSIAVSVRKVLSQNPPYQLFKEVQPEKVFEAKFKPYWWGASSYIKVSLEEEESSNRVIVEITSPRYMIGDVFAFYNKLIDDFMLDLRNHMESTNPKFVYRYNQDSMRFLQLIGLSIGISGIIVLLIGLVQSIKLKVLIPGLAILFVTSALFLGYGMFGARMHKRMNQ